MTIDKMLQKSIGIRLGVLALLIPLPPHAQAVNLTTEEQAYLDKLGQITMCVGPDWKPYERIDARGNFTGSPLTWWTLFQNDWTSPL